MNNIKRRKHLKSLGPSTLVVIHPFITHLKQRGRLRSYLTDFKGIYPNNIYQEHNHIMKFKMVDNLSVMLMYLTNVD